MGNRNNANKQPDRQGRSGAKAALRPPKQAQPPKEQERKNTTMKKFMAILLVAIMMLSTVAFATSASTITGRDPADGEANKDSFLNTNGAESKFLADEGHDDIKAGNDHTTGEVDTELWLQVTAGGQIDVTVPLVLIFSTNIDGGTATQAQNYKIINNNLFNSVSVDKIEVTTETQNDITLVSKATALGDGDGKWTNATRDQYYVVFTPAFDDANAANNEGFKDGKDATITEYDLNDATGTTQYNLTGADKTDLVLFQIREGGNVNLNPTMATTALTFATHDGNDAISNGLGLKLLTVKYTVGLKYNVVDAEGITNVSEEMTPEKPGHTHTYNSGTNP